MSYLSPELVLHLASLCRGLLSPPLGRSSHPPSIYMGAADPNFSSHACRHSKHPTNWVYSPAPKESFLHVASLVTTTKCSTQKKCSMHIFILPHRYTGMHGLIFDSIISLLPQGCSVELPLLTVRMTDNTMIYIVPKAPAISHLCFCLLVQCQHNENCCYGKILSENSKLDLESLTTLQLLAGH